MENLWRMYGGKRLNDISRSFYTYSIAAARLQICSLISRATHNTNSAFLQLSSVLDEEAQECVSPTFDRSANFGHSDNFS